MHILYCCNDSYCPYTGISIVSLFENNKHLEELFVHVVGLGISAENLFKLEKTAEKYGRQIKVIDADEIEKLLTESSVSDYRGNKITFYRIFIDRFFPDSALRVLYIDGDTIITGALDELETYEFATGKACAMIRERVFEGYNSIIGLKESDLYHNAGITLFDMNNWEKLNCNERLLRGVRDGLANFHLADQDLMCSVLNENIQDLPLKYNVHSLWLNIGIKNLYWYFDVDEHNFYPVSEIIEAVENPVIMHCSKTISCAPWERGNRNPFKEEWRRYKEISLWKDIKDIKVKRDLKKRINWILFCVLPRVLYLKIIKNYYVRSLTKRYGKNN